MDSHTSRDAAERQKRRERDENELVRPFRGTNRKRRKGGGIEGREGEEGGRKGRPFNLPRLDHMPCYSVPSKRFANVTPPLRVRIGISLRWQLQ